MRSLFLILLVLTLKSVSFAETLNPWMEKQYTTSINNLFKNMSPDGTRPGAVIASPSRQNPDYWFHWVRDAALVMEVVSRLDQSTKVPKSIKAEIPMTFRNFVDFTHINQTLYSPVGLGEPKYYVDGRPYDGPWGRPQNDGPALRSLTLTRFAQKLLNEGELHYVRRHLYNSDLPANTVIKRDLEYVSHHWREASFDLWEEVKGQHFYTKLVQRSALLEGADIAERLNDTGAAQFYRAQARGLDQSLKNHLETGRPYIVENLRRVEGIWYKHSGLDTATVLAYLHTQGSQYSWSLSDSFVACYN
ncbi:MAG: glycoside hydrolase family 15 protein [Bdellovibrionales bacterium]